jgi:formate C-acetyltransferase
MSTVTIEEQRTVAWTYEERLKVLKTIKQQQTDKKREYGPRDTDDWGQVPCPEGFTFIPETDHPKGYVAGARSCGHNFRRFLNAVPLYVNKYGSLLGGYCTLFNEYTLKWDPANHPVEIASEIIKYNIIDGMENSHHFCGDVRIGLKLGWGGLLEKIRQHKDPAKEVDPGFYEALENTVMGIQEWIQRHVEEARQMAEWEDDPDIKANLLQMAATSEKCISDPPETFHQAVQWLAWFQMADRSYNGSGALGRIDQYLYSYYVKDVEDGTLDDEDAVFDFICLNLSDPHYIHLGGIDSTGADVTNELSYLVLEAAHRLKVPANIAVGVHDDMPPELMRKSVELLFVDKLGTPRFHGSIPKAEGYAKNGVPIELARERVQAGCHWFNLPGTEYSFSDVIKINFAKILDIALHEMVQGEESEQSLETVWNIFQKHLKRAVKVTAIGIDYHMEYSHRYFPELVLDLVSVGPIEKGYDAKHGALEYNTICVDGSALATVADSFAAMEVVVETNKQLTWRELVGILDRDFKGQEKYRQLLINVPSYGRGGTVGDAWAEKISKTYSELVVSEPTPDGWKMIPGIFSWASTMKMGLVTPATPNGRKNGEPISFGANPDGGMFKGGPVTPTSMALAVAKVQPGYGDAAPMQLDVDPGLVYSDDGVDQFDALLRGHFKMGGTLVNANILDKEKILDAYHNPDKYPDLVVRVTGFSAYFASLSPEFRKLVYDRIVAMEEVA